MTIQEAIKSGKPFRRHKCNGPKNIWNAFDIPYSEIERLVFVMEDGDEEVITQFTFEELAATDWEVKP